MAAFGVVALVIAIVAILGWSDEHGTSNDDEPERSAEAGNKAGDTLLPVQADPDSQSPLLPLDGVVEGSVRGPEQEPLPGARVCVWPGENETVPLERQLAGSCTQTDASGRYRIESLPRMQLRVAASAPGFGSAVVPAEGAPLARTVPGQVVRIDVDLLHEGVLIQGRVVDASGGPIAGAWVRPHLPTRLPSLRKYERPSGPVALTDDEGRFSLWTRPGFHLLGATASGYGYGFEGAEAPGSEIEIRLVPEAVLGGVVLDAQGEPVSLVRVELEPSQPVYDATRLIAYSDAEGRFRLSGLRGGDYTVSAISDAGRAELEEPVTVAPGQTRDDLRIDLATGFPITVRVLEDGSEDQPCTGGFARLEGAKTLRASIAPDGVATIPGVPPGTYPLTVHCWSAIDPEQTPTLEVIDAPVEVSVEVAPGFDLRGQVRDPQGTGLFGVQVIASKVEPEGPSGPRALSRMTVTDDSGSFALEGLVQGHYRLEASAPEHPDADPIDVVVPDDSEVIITLDAGASLEVAVIDPAGQGVERQRVVATPRDQASFSRACWTSSDGRCTIEGLAPGPHQVGVLSLVATPGIDPVDVDLTYQGPNRVELRSGARDHSLEGTVVDADGHPLADVRLRALPYDARTSPTALEHALDVYAQFGNLVHVTDADGHFVIDDLSDASHAVVVTKPGYAPRTLHPIDPSSGPIRIVLQPAD